MRPPLSRTASTYSSKCRAGVRRAASHITRVARTAPKIGVAIRRPAESDAAAAGSEPACWTKTHCSSRKNNRTPTHANALALPRTTGSATLGNQAVTERLVEFRLIAVAALMRMPNPMLFLRRHRSFPPEEPSSAASFESAFRQDQQPARGSRVLQWIRSSRRGARGRG